jgi:hypothetical protein
MEPLEVGGRRRQHKHEALVVRVHLTEIDLRPGELPIRIILEKVQ